ncbi:MAG: hypothetical protein KME05_17730 [Gloeocapsa sp. UFS-A4-WI-NPMV-4B04]|nr:hypothetical protein [Gloeocapsa sp. UFS-A4-WI-NPMV-4B04]
MSVERVIEAVGVDSNRPDSGAAASQAQQFQQALQQITPETNPQGSNWHLGNAPSQVVTWAVQALAKAGTLSIISVYPPKHQFFPLGMAMNKNLTVNMGNCKNRKYIPCW